MTPHDPNRARVLIADDDGQHAELIARLMQRQGHSVYLAANGEAALSLVEQSAPDLVLLDVEMPRLNGFEVCARLKAAEATRLLPVVLITSLSGSTDRIRGIEAGADDFISKPIRPEELRARTESLLRLKRYTDDLDSAESAILSIAQTVEARDPYTGGHCERLANYGSAVGVAMGLDAEDVQALRRGGYLHDVGKIAVSDAVLFKPGPLTAEEFTVIKTHAIEGERLCGSVRSLRRVRPIVRHHHERRDGSGYPDRLRGDDIPLLAQIIGVVDAFDAMTTDRPYRKGREATSAYAELRLDARGGRLDEQLVETFIAVHESSNRTPP